ncbi:MAG: type III pantothenate kinase [bacterium]|nr:type III pantothenate kinase [bacterium]
MLAVFDIGNTNIVVGIFKEEVLLHEFRLKTDTARTEDEYAASMFSLFQMHFGEKFRCRKAIISSVVPALTPLIINLVEHHLGAECLVVGPGLKTGVQIKTEDPKAVGADRIVNCAACKVLYGCPSLVIDFGTATTFDYIGSDGSYEGGAIAPGVTTAINALVRNTAKLPQIELKWPSSTVARNTVEAMQSGSIIGYVCMVDGMVQRIEAEKGTLKHIIATGGLGRLMADHSNRIQKYDGSLTLVGLRLIAEMNFK